MCPNVSLNYECYDDEGGGAGMTRNVTGDGDCTDSIDDYDGLVSEMHSVPVEET